MYKAKKFMLTKNNLKNNLHNLEDGASGGIEQLFVKNDLKYDKIIFN